MCASRGWKLGDAAGGERTTTCRWIWGGRASINQAGRGSACTGVLVEEERV